MALGGRGPYRGVTWQVASLGVTVLCVMMWLVQVESVHAVLPVHLSSTGAVSFGCSHQGQNRHHGQTAMHALDATKVTIIARGIQWAISLWPLRTWCTKLPHGA